MAHARELDKKLRPRRRRLLVWLAVLAILGTIAWLERAPIASAVAKSLARRLAGVELEWEHLEVHGLSRVHATGVRAHGVRDDALVRELEIDAFDVELDLRRIVSSGLAGLDVLRARGVRAHLVPPPRTEPSGSTNVAFEWPADL